VVIIATGPGTFCSFATCLRAKAYGIFTGRTVNPAKFRELETFRRDRTFRPSHPRGPARSAAAGEEQFSSFLKDAHAKSMVDRGGIGLAEAIYRAMTEQNDAG
jgi:hypothetical protein